MYPVQKTLIKNNLSFCTQNKNGWITEGLLAAIFVGLALFILLYSWIPTTIFFRRWQVLSYTCALIVIILFMAVTYTWVAKHRKRRFQRGSRDYLLMRKLMRTCLMKDCGQIEALLSVPDHSDIGLLHQMLLCQVQYVLDNEGLRIRDIHVRFEKSRIKRINGIHLETIFYNVKEYDQKKLPDEFGTVFKAVDVLASNLQPQISHLKNSRRDLFTVMSDYLEILEVTQEEVKKIQAVYRYNPPEYHAAQKIVFAKKTIDYLKKYHQDKLSDERRFAMEEVAAEKVSQLRTSLENYRNAWKSLVKAYETLPLR